MANQLLTPQHIAFELLILVNAGLRARGTKIVGPILDNPDTAHWRGDVHVLWHDIGFLSPQDLTLTIDEFSRLFLAQPATEVAEVIHRRSDGAEVAMVKLPPRHALEASEQICDPRYGTSINYEAAYSMLTNQILMMVRASYVVRRRRTVFAWFDFEMGFETVTL